MFCSECRASNSDNAKFCYQCGTTLFFPNQAKQVQPLDNLPKEKNNRVIYFVAGGLLLALILLGVGVVGAIIGANYFRATNEQNLNRFVNAPVQPIQTPTVAAIQTPKITQPVQTPVLTPTPQIPQKRIILNKTIPVKASSYSWIPFNLSKQSQIIGKITAQGGSNDIETIVLDSDEFVNYQNTGRFRSYFKSGYVTISNIDLTLPKGNYYIIFNNSGALLTSKVVTAKLEQIEVE